MANATLQDAALFANPKHIVGANSAGPIQTSIFPNYGAVPNRFGNNKVFLTDNMYNGTNNNITAAGGKYSGNGSPLTGGRRRRTKRRSSKHKGKRSNAGMNKSSKKKSSSPKKKSTPKRHSSPHAASGECRYCDYGDEGEHKQSPSNLCKECQVYARSRGLLYGGNGKRLQTMGPPDQANGAITANGGTVGAGAPQVGTYQLMGGLSKKRKARRGRRTKRRTKGKKRGTKGKKRRVGKKSRRHGRKGKSRRRVASGGCTHLLKQTNNKSGGGGKQLEFAQGFGINGKNDTLFGALSSPIPIKAYNSCGLIKPRN